MLTYLFASPSNLFPLLALSPRPYSLLTLRSTCLLSLLIKSIRLVGCSSPQPTYIYIPSRLHTQPGLMCAHYNSSSKFLRTLAYVFLSTVEMLLQKPQPGPIPIQRVQKGHFLLSSSIPFPFPTKKKPKTTCVEQFQLWRQQQQQHVLFLVELLEWRNLSRTSLSPNRKFSWERK